MNMSGVTTGQARGSLLFAFVGIKKTGHVVHAEEEGEGGRRRKEIKKSKGKARKGG